MVELDRPQMTIWRMRFACWITKATNTLNIQYLLLFHGNNKHANAYHCCFIRILPVSLNVSHITSKILRSAVGHHQGHFMMTIYKTLISVHYGRLVNCTPKHGGNNVLIRYS